MTYRLRRCSHPAAGIHHLHHGLRRSLHHDLHRSRRHRCSHLEETVSSVAERDVHGTRLTTATATAEAATSTSSTVTLRCFVDANGAAVEPSFCQPSSHGIRGVRDLLNVVHGLDRGIGTGLLSEAHEAKATASACVAILDDNLQFISIATVAQLAGCFNATTHCNIPPRQLDRTPQTWLAESGRRCAMQGRCRNVSSGHGT